MLLRDLVYVGHRLDMAKKAVSKIKGLPRDSYDADENLRLALMAALEPIVPPALPATNDQ